METANDDKLIPKVEVIDGGPLKITGNIVLKDLKRGIEQTAAEVLVCRCGRSLKMPFCDRSHGC
jgi:CDGSH iron-sulfur domain-containing protein 3